MQVRVPTLDLEDPLEEDRATHSSILVWRIPGTEESDGQYKGSWKSQKQLSD